MPVFEMFSADTRRYLGEVEALCRRIAGTSYEFVPESSLGAIVEPRVLVRNYTLEILSRTHAVAFVSMARSLRWADATTNAVNSENFFAFCACFRGLIESAADTYDCLTVVPMLLASNMRSLREAVKGSATAGLDAGELEDRLIHFLFARKLGKTELAPNSHRRKEVWQYLKLLKEHGGSLVEECYRELCEVTHAAHASVSPFFMHVDRSLYKVAMANDGEWLASFNERFGDIFDPLVQRALTPSVLTLKVLNVVLVPHLQTPSVEKYSLDGVAAWPAIAAELEAQGCL